MTKKTLVFGASLKPERYSNMVVHRLVNQGHEVKAFGLKRGNIAGVEVDTELKPYIGIDTVSLYLSPKRQTPFYDYIVSLQPKRVIFNPGTENSEFYELLNSKGIVAEIACNLVLLATNQY